MNPEHTEVPTPGHLGTRPRIGGTSPATTVGGLRVLARVPDLSQPAAHPAMATAATATARQEEPEVLDRADEHVSAGLQLAAQWLVAAKQATWLARLPVLAQLVGLGVAWAAALQTAAALAALVQKLSKSNWSDLRQPRLVVAGSVLTAILVWSVIMSRHPATLPNGKSPAAGQVAANVGHAPALPAHEPGESLATADVAAPTAELPTAGSATAAGDANRPPSWQSEAGPALAQTDPTARLAQAAPQANSPAAGSDLPSAAQAVDPALPAAPSANSPADLSAVPPVPQWESSSASQWSAQGTAGAQHPSGPVPSELPTPPSPGEQPSGPSLGSPVDALPPGQTPGSPPHPSQWSKASRQERVASRITGVRAAPGPSAAGHRSIQGIRQVPLTPTTRMR